MIELKLMADYGCFPLWFVPPAAFGNVNPDTLPISKELKDRLSEWADSYDKTLNLDDPPSSGFANKLEEEFFVKEGLSLAERLRFELGPDYSVVVRICIGP